MKTAGMEVSMRDGDIFLWRYTNAQLRKMNHGNNAGTTYWCCSNIAVFDGCVLKDTFWNGGSEGRHFGLEDVGEKIEVTFLANFDELVKAPTAPELHYRKDDIVDLRHPNNSSHGNVYIRRGSERSIEVMREALKNKIAEHLRKAESEKWFADRAQENLNSLTEENKESIYV